MQRVLVAVSPVRLSVPEVFRSIRGSNEDAFALLVDSELNKWASDGISDSSQRLWEDIQRARAQSELSVAVAQIAALSQMSKKH